MDQPTRTPIVAADVPPQTQTEVRAKARVPQKKVARAAPRRQPARPKVEQKQKPAPKPARKPKLARKKYERELTKLQVKLCYLQDWVRETGARIIVICEGRDTAGKGGLIKRLTERVSPRTFRIVALSAPKEGERQTLFMQRYIENFPAAGEVVIFDRSWYNRAGIERVMGFASKKDVRKFLTNIPMFERWVTDAGVILIKLWLEVSKDEQERRFRARIEDPLRQWKLSPMDLKSYARWYEYSRARDDMLQATDSPHAPWYVVRSDDKKRARLNAMAHILAQIPFEQIKRPKAELPKRSNKRAYDDALDPDTVNFVAELF